MERIQARRIFNELANPTAGVDCNGEEFANSNPLRSMTIALGLPERLYFNDCNVGKMLEQDAKIGKWFREIADALDPQE